MDSRQNFLCSYSDCDYSSVSYNRLLNHVWERHGIHSSFSHTCNISSCTRSYTNLQSFRRHVKTKHAWFYDTHLRRYSQNDQPMLNSLLNNGSTDHQDDLLPNHEAEGSLDHRVGDGSSDIDETAAAPTEQAEEADLPKVPLSKHECDDIVSDFLLRLRENFNVTQEAVSFVSEQVSKILNKDRGDILAQVKDSLNRNIESFSLDYETDCLVNSASLFCSSFEDFKGKTRLDNFILSSDFYVAPVQIDLGVNPTTFKQESFQYVPILETLNVILKHEDMLGFLLNPPQQSPNDNNGEQIFESYRDGSLFSTNDLFKEHPNSLQIILYHDDFNIVNPLGNKTEKYKISAFYFVLGNVSCKYQARLKDINLVLLSPASLVSKYGYEAVLEPLLEDIKKLETEGIHISYQGIDHHFYGTITMVVADNLAAHALGGYFCNFSTVERVCRFCNFRKSQLNSCYPVSHFTLRSKEAYENNVNSIKENPSYCSLYGIKEDSCLNQLSYFHVVNGLPPDIAHDVFEGFAIDVLYQLVSHYLRENYFTIECLNEIISSFPYSNSDGRNKPQPFKGTTAATLKIKQTACEMWTLLRLFPLMVGSLIDEGDKYWNCFLNFVDIVERLCSLKFSHAELLMVQSLIDTFLAECASVFSEIKMKPKSHFLQHYPQMIRQFGPLVKTLRFESKHSYFKSLTRVTKNRVNLCFSLCKRHQMNMSLHYKKAEILNHDDISGTYSKEVALEQIGYPFQETIQNFFNLGENELLSTSKSVSFQGVRYSMGEVVVLDFVSDEPLLGLIDSAWFHNGEICLLLDILEIQRYNSHFHSYEVLLSGNYQVSSILSIYDYHPLSCYMVAGKRFVPLHHYISN